MKGWSCFTEDECGKNRFAGKIALVLGMLYLRSLQAPTWSSRVRSWIYHCGFHTAKSRPKSKSQSSMYDRGSYKGSKDQALDTPTTKGKNKSISDHWGRKNARRVLEAKWTKDIQKGEWSTVSNVVHRHSKVRTEDWPLDSESCWTLVQAVLVEL